jgi:hypothetical protein
MEHGFTWFRVICFVLAILIIFGIRYGTIIIPQIRGTADQVANLNNLQKIDLKIGGCIPIKGNL